AGFDFRSIRTNFEGGIFRLGQALPMPPAKPPTVTGTPSTALSGTDGLESKLAFLPRLLGAGSASERLETVLGQHAAAPCYPRAGLHWPAGPHPQVRVAVDRSGRPAGTPPSPNGSAGPLCGPGGEATLGTAKGTRSWASLDPSPDRPGYLWAEPEAPEDWA